MVFNTTSSDISVMSWRSALLMEETRVTGKNTDLPKVNDKLHQIMVCWLNTALRDNIMLNTKYQWLKSAYRRLNAELLNILFEPLFT